MALGPIDYSIDVATPFESALKGYQAGAAIRQDQMQQQQQQLALQQQQRQQQYLQQFMSKPQKTAQDYADAIVQMPQLREQFESSWKLRSADQQQSHLSDVSQYYAAVRNGKPEIAADLMDQRATAMENSGADKREIDALRTQAQLVREHPEFAGNVMGLMLASLPGGDKVIESVGKIGAEDRAAAKAPAELRTAEAGANKAEADAETAKVAAKYADQSAVMDLQKKGWDIKKVVADIEIAKEANRIAAMNAATSREGNQLKREELQLKAQEARTALDDKIREKVAGAEASAATMDNMLNTIERLRKNPALGTVVGPVAGNEMYPHTLMGSNTAAAMGITASANDRADAIALIEQLGSQAFLSQVPNMKGQGALSNAEGEKLQAALANLKRTQSEKQFRESLDEAFRLVNKGRQNLSVRTGVPLSAPDIPAARPKPSSSDFQPQASGSAAPATTKGGATVSSW
jgi:hypothetical protein